MSELKRIPIKYIRDFIKKDYKLRDACFICGTIENLELHHIYSISELFTGWCDTNKVGEITTVASMNEIRERFYIDERERLEKDKCYTLCKVHHERLHNIYGQKYANRMAPKVINWIQIQKEKHGIKLASLGSRET